MRIQQFFVQLFVGPLAVEQFKRVALEKLQQHKVLRQPSGGLTDMFPEEKLVSGNVAAALVSLCQGG